MHGKITHPRPRQRGRLLAAPPSVAIFCFSNVTRSLYRQLIPTPLIAAREIRFRPELTDKTAAALVLPLGLAVAVDEPEWLPVDGQLIGDPNKTATSSYHFASFRQASHRRIFRRTAGA